MGSIARAAAAIAAVLVREGLDYAQSKAVFKMARQRAGLHAPPEKRLKVERLSVEEELRFLDHAYGQDGRTGLMLQTLLETACSGFSFRGRAKLTPLSLAASRPALVRSRMRSRSNSAIPANTVMISLPAWVVVSAHGSDSD
jgi:hypothetical protein